MKKVYWHFGIALLSVSLVLAACDTVGGVSPYFQAVRDAADLLAELEALGESAGGVDVTRDGTTVTLEATTGTPTVTLTDDLPIQAGVTLAVGANVTLEVPAGKALTVEGTLDVEGTLTVNGAVTNNGIIHHKSGDSATALNELIGNIGHGTGEADIPLTAEFYGSVSTATATGGFVINEDSATDLAHVTITGDGTSELAAGLTVQRPNVTLDNVDFSVTANTKTPQYGTNGWKTAIWIGASDVTLQNSVIDFVSNNNPAKTIMAVNVTPSETGKTEAEVSTEAAQLSGIRIINNKITVTAHTNMAAMALRVHGAAAVEVKGNELTAKRTAGDDDGNGDYIDVPVRALYIYNIPNSLSTAQEALLANGNFTGNTLNGHNFDFELHPPIDGTLDEASIGNFSTASTTFFKGDSSSWQKLFQRIVAGSSFTHTNTSGIADGGFAGVYLRRPNGNNTNSSINDYDRETYKITGNRISVVSYFAGDADHTSGTAWGSLTVDADNNTSANSAGFFISRDKNLAPLGTSTTGTGTPNKS